MSFLAGLVSSLAAPLLGGLFSSKQSNRQNEYNEEAYKQQRADSIEDQLAMLPRLRESAEAAGFNPLTALGLTGGAGFGQTGATKIPKLASPSAAANAITGASDWITSQAAAQLSHKRAADRINEINEDRTLQKSPAQKAVKRTTATIETKTLGLPSLKPERQVANTNVFQASPISLAPGREVETIAPANTAGVFAMNNALTFGKDVILPGDSEPWGIDELGTAVAVGSPQVIYQGIRTGINEYRQPEQVARRAHARSVMFPGLSMPTEGSAVRKTTKKMAKGEDSKSAIGSKSRKAARN